MKNKVRTYNVRVKFPPTKGSSSECVDHLSVAKGFWSRMNLDPSLSFTIGTKVDDICSVEMAVRCNSCGGNSIHTLREKLKGYYGGVDFDEIYRHRP